MTSAVVLTKNEENNIIGCLEALEWCDEIIVIDDYSEDETLKRIFNFQASCLVGRQAIFKQKDKVKIFKRHLNNDFAGQRNDGLKRARGDWVLFVDADERVTPSLREEITRYTNNPMTQFSGFLIKRRDFLFGRWLKHGETGNVKLLRLAKKDAGKWIRPVHEVWKINGQVGELKNPLLHYPHQTIKEFLQDINFYTTLHAKGFYENGGKVSWWQICLFPLAKFIVNYWLRLGFLDGLPGFLHAALMSFHSFLTRAKLWFLWQKYEIF